MGGGLKGVTSKGRGASKEGVTKGSFADLQPDEGVTKGGLADPSSG